MAFFGRKEELEILHSLAGNPLAVATITGRRRIGKSRLVTEYAQREGMQLIKIEGRDTPEKGNAAQLEAFAADLSKATGTSKVTFDNWNSAFDLLGTFAQDKRWIILLDEITWLARHSEECLAELKVFIDRYINGSGNRLIVCGSVSQWIQQHINDSDLFLGRISKKIDLKPLALSECAQFWAGRDVATREILTMLCVTGGVPRYIEEIKVTESADWNIRKLCFDSTGYMAQELPNLIKSSLLNATREASLQRYLAILQALSGNGKTHAEIGKTIGVHANQGLTGHLAALKLSGLISENPSWNLKTANEQQRQVRYRIEDPYTRFYMKYIRPNLRKIDKGMYRYVTLEQLPGWEAIRGLQFEALVGQSMAPVILEKLDLRGVAIECFGPYFQSAAARRKAVQIDYMLQTADTLYVCEMRFRKSIEATVVDEVREKIKRLGVPKNMTVRRVLIYSGEREQALQDSIYFDRQIGVDGLLHEAD
jgi:AAA+ ATPase superfamily predicted ATPase